MGAPSSWQTPGRLPKGVVRECGTRLFKIGATPDHAGLPQPAAEVKAKVKAEAKAKTEVKTKAKAEGWEQDGGGGQVSDRNRPSQDARGKAAGKSFARAIHPASQAGHRRVAGEGAHGRPLPGPRVTRFGRRWATCATCCAHSCRSTSRTTSCPSTVCPTTRKTVVKNLKAPRPSASEVYLATDPDREGEAIAWHLLEAADIAPERRAHVSSFTRSRRTRLPRPSATAATSTCGWSMRSRRGASSTGWSATRSARCCGNACRGRLSAGRVQSVALRLDRRARAGDRWRSSPVEYWSMDAELAQQATREQQPRLSFLARLVRIRGRGS